MAKLSTYSFVTGKAGTGKSTIIRKLAKEHPADTLLCATTGIAAINLGSEGDSATTINSLLGYFNTESLQESYDSGKLLRKLFKLNDRTIVIDEASMLGAGQFSILAKAVSEVNDNGANIRLILVGDFCQLAPVNDAYAFETPEWKIFASGVVRLNKVWRQDNTDFLELLNAARVGDGDKVVEILKSTDKVKFKDWIEGDFKGTTLIATYAGVDAFNSERYQKLLATGKKEVVFPRYNWGKQRPEWVKNLPAKLSLCDSAYVMILANGYDTMTGDFYANGNCGEILSIDGSFVNVYLENLKHPVKISPIIRPVLVREKPSDGILKEEARERRTIGYFDNTREEYIEAETTLDYQVYLENLTAKHRMWGSPWYSYTEHMWCIGEIKYLPLRLAYASTVHKAQGLTLGEVQIDFTQQYMAAPSMAYVALSRVKRLEDIQIVGSLYQVIERTNVHTKVVPWI